jgi:hypothetical protein
MQLDIFADSRDVMLRNDVADALQRRDAVAARGALQLLLSDHPSDDLLPALSTPTLALDEPRPERFGDHDALQHARGEITRKVMPAAARVFGDTAGSAWLAPFWRALAHAAEHLPLCRNEHDAHAVPLWIKVGDWVAAQEAIARIASWRRIPTTLCWMAEAQYHQHGLEAIWPLLAELAWLSASRLDGLMHRLKDSFDYAAQDVRPSLRGRWCRRGSGVVSRLGIDRETGPREPTASDTTVDSKLA